MREKEMKDFHCKNQRCNLVVGTTDGEAVFLFGKLVPFEPLYFAFDCPKCGKKITWERAGYRKSLHGIKKV